VSVLRRVSVLLTVASVAAACSGGSPSATVLDVPFRTLTSLHPKEKHPYANSPLPIRFRIDISNPSDQDVWANDCRAQAFDGRGRLLYRFTFGLGIGGAEMRPHGSYAADWTAYARQVSPDEVRATARATATCQAWDWHGNPPI